MSGYIVSERIERACGFGLSMRVVFFKNRHSGCLRIDVNGKTQGRFLFIVRKPWGLSLSVRVTNGFY